MGMLLVLTPSVVGPPTAQLPPARALMLHGKPILSTCTLDLF